MTKKPEEQFAERYDLDAIARSIHNRLTTAHRGWVKGEILEEVAFLNRAIERMKSPWHCKYGLDAQIATPNVSAMVLHRADNNSDAFGSDIAVTVEVPRIGYLKTALIQVKPSNNGKAKLDGDQITKMINDSEVKGRSFVLAVDKNRPLFAIQGVVPLQTHSGAKQPQVRCEDWSTLKKWVLLWLKCKEGIMSDSTLRSIENRLERLRDSNSAPIAGLKLRAWIKFLLQ